MSISAFKRMFLFAIVTSCCATGFGQSLDIKGSVVDTANKPIPGVKIRIYRQTQLLAETRADKTGEYAATLKPGGRVTLVRYDLTGWCPGKVENISGANPNVINKVLLRPGEINTLLEKAELQATLDLLSGIDLANGVSTGEFYTDYQASLSLMEMQLLDESYGMAHFFRPPRRYMTKLEGMANLLRIEKPSGEQLSKNLLKISFDVTSPSSGWRVWSISFKQDTKLHVWAVGDRLKLLSSSPGKYSLSETYDVEGVTEVIVHGADDQYIIPIVRK